MELNEAKEILELTPYEENMIKCYNLDFSQILWYRWTLKNDCHGDWNMMKQENPTSPEEAFISTGNPVFDNEKIQLRIEQLRLLYDKSAPKKGRFYFEWEDPESQNKIVDSSIRWIDDPHGIITIYEDKKDGVPYVLGGDTKGEGRDKYAGTVINNTTGNRCATLWQQSRAIVVNHSICIFQQTMNSLEHRFRFRLINRVEEHFIFTQPFSSPTQHI